MWFIIFKSISASELSRFDENAILMRKKFENKWSVFVCLFQSQFEYMGVCLCICSFKKKKKNKFDQRLSYHRPIQFVLYCVEQFLCVDLIFRMTEVDRCWSVWVWMIFQNIKQWKMCNTSKSYTKKRIEKIKNEPANEIKNTLKPNYSGKSVIKNGFI